MLPRCNSVLVQAWTAHWTMDIAHKFDELVTMKVSNEKGNSLSRPAHLVQTYSVTFLISSDYLIIIIHHK